MSTTDLPGPTLLAGRYRLVERLGAGGMSVVWRGFDEVLGRQVAVKVLPPSVSADPSFRRRLRAEAQAAARLSHPHITNVYDYGEAATSGGDLVPFVVMELVDGESLAGVLGRLHQLPWHVAVRICAQASAALAAAHARGIVHRDVTPANVMLTSSGVKVVDFGISALIGENDADPDGSLLGTPAYLAPERLSGGQVSPASDVYAVGLLIYRALIGQLPWDVGTTTALLRAHQYTQPGPLPPVEGMPPAVNALVGRCLEKQPADRPSSAELSAVLAQISAGGPAVTESWAGYGQDTTILPAPDEYPDPARRDAPVPAAPVPFDASAARPPVPVPFGAVRGAAPAGPASTGCDPVAASRLAAVSVSAGSATAAPGAGPAPPQPSAGTPLAGRPGPAVAAGIVAPRNSRFGPAPPAAAAAPSGDGRPTPPGSAQPTVADAAAQPGQWATTPAPVVRIRPPAGAAPVRGQDHQSFGPARGAAASPGDQPGRAHPAAAAPIGPPSGRPASGAGVSSGHARRLSVVLALVAAVGAVGYGWSGWTGAADGSRQQAAPEQLLPAQPRRCVVTYAIRSRSGKTFAAALMLTNRAPSSVTDWQLRFVLPGDQQVRATGTVNLEQEGRDVTVRSAGAIEPHRTVVVNLAGSYQQNNDVPVDFELDDVTCDVYVSSAPGAPPLQVQTSPEGRVTLAAPPPGTPVPGLSSRPDGAFVPVATDEPRGATGRPSRNAPGDAPTSVPSSNSTTGTASATTTAPLPPSPPSVITSGPTATTSTSGTAPAATTAPNTTAPATTAPTKRPPPPIFTRPTTESPSS